MLKFLDGGWVPLVIAAVIFNAMWTWLQGRLAVGAREKEGTLPIESLLDSIGPGRVHRPQGTAVYLTAFSGNAPNCLLHNLKHNEVLHEHVVLLTVEVPDEPYVAADQRSQITHLGKGVHRMVLRYGFIEQPDVPRDLSQLADKGASVRPDADLLLHRPQQLRRREPSAAAALAAEAVPDPGPPGVKRRRLLRPAGQPRRRAGQPDRDLAAPAILDAPFHMRRLCRTRRDLLEFICPSF
jgi:K+ transporter